MMRRSRIVCCSSLALALLATASIPGARAAEEQIQPQAKKGKSTPAVPPAAPVAEKTSPTGPTRAQPGECPVMPRVNTLEDIVRASNPGLYTSDKGQAQDATPIVWRDVKPEQPARR